jgi:hypothetical protein
MTITIDLEPEAEERLHAIAREEGKDVSLVVKESIDERIRKSNRRPKSKRSRKLSDEQWRKEFKALIKSYPRLDHPVDDSRDSIYPD